jgi:hypothetical protein
VEKVEGTITLRKIQGAHTVSLQAMDGAGQPTGAPVQAAASGDDWKMPIGDTATTWYQITISR